MKILLWHARDNKNMKLRELSEKSGISKSKLWRIETGRRSPTLDELKAVSKVLNISIYELFCDED